VKINLGVVGGTFHPSFAGSVNGKITVQAGPGKITRTYLKITKAKKD
jgi:hypothetical protein